MSFLQDYIEAKDIAGDKVYIKIDSVSYWVKNAKKEKGVFYNRLVFNNGNVMHIKRGSVKHISEGLVDLFDWGNSKKRGL